MTDDQRPVAFAVELFLDPASDAYVRSVWASLTAAGIPALTSLSQQYRPHVSLLVFEIDDVAAAAHHLDRLAPSIADLRLSLSSVGVFPGTAVLFYGVTVTGDLLATHSSMQEALVRSGAAPWEHYTTGIWVPHCTLAMSLPPESRGVALDLALQAPLPIHATAASAALVEVPGGLIRHKVDI